MSNDAVVEQALSEDMSRQLRLMYDRVRLEKNALRFALQEVITKPACSSCIRTAQDLLGLIHNE